MRPRCIAGLERVGEASYCRAARIDDQTVSVEIRGGGSGSLEVRTHGVESDAIPGLRPRLRALLGLDLDAEAADRHLAADPLFAPAIAAGPGLTVPGTLDPFELALRAVLGQQVSIAGAATLAGRLGARFSTSPAVNGLKPCPTPGELCDADVGAIGLPRSRADTIRALARATIEDKLLLQPGARSLEEAVAALDAVRGIGPWTAHYIAMRALRHGDAFPEGDLGLLKAVGEPMTPAGKRALLARAERWRPFRASATLRLWSLL